jgi:hypothetical protein
MRLLTTTLLLALVASAQATTTKDVPIPQKLPPPTAEDAGPTVTIRASDNGDRVEEYRQGGQVYMVKVTPARGRPYYLYDDDGNGRLDRSDAEKNDISPVYWTVYEWE